MKKTAFAGILVLIFGLPALAQRGDGPLDPSPPQGITADEIVQRFAAKEKEFKEARENYTYTQDITVQALDGNTVTGEYREVFDIGFDDKGRRYETVRFAPQSSLDKSGIGLSKSDLDDLRYHLAFVLTTDDLPLYEITYVGRQTVDELQSYVFDIRPKRMEPGKPFFDGRMWVDDRDFQIVKVRGKRPDTVNKKGQGERFPTFTTWRQQVDGRYWFPVYTKADEVLEFGQGDVRIREIIKYSNYKRFGSKVKITYEGQELPTEEQKPQPPPQPQKPPKN